MAYSIVDLASSLDLHQCRVRSTPNLIFLCGGRLNPGTGPASARDFFVRAIHQSEPALAKRVCLAEVVNEWFDSKVFADLLELEQYLADISDLTLLFVESEGSIAELGAFAAMDELRPKTLAVINTAFKTRKTFIADGPVKRLRSGSRKLVQSFNWATLMPDPGSDEALSAMADRLIGILRRRAKAGVPELQFDFDKPGHTLLLVADLVAIAGVATWSDLTKCLAAVGLPKSRHELRRYIHLLGGLGLVHHTAYGVQPFFVRHSPENFLSYGYRPAALVKDIARNRHDVRAGLEPVKRRVFKDHLKSTLGIRHA